MGQLSPDGHWQWDGWRWVPAHAVPLAPPPGTRLPRVPTVWTRRLQILLLVVAAWGIVSAIIWAFLLPASWGGLEMAIVAQWQAEGISAAEIQTLLPALAAMLPVTLVVVLVWSAGFCTLQVLGTLRRWVWWYWVQLAICGLTALSLLLTLIDLAVLLAGPTGAGAAMGVYRAEAGLIPLTLVGDLLDVAAGVCMLIAAIGIGPWAMTRRR